MKILKAGTHGFYDCFFGDGWKNHTRITIKKTQYGPRIFYHSGIPLTKDKYIQIGNVYGK